MVADQIDRERPPPFGRNVLLALACAALVLTLAMGIRQSFGIFLQPITMDLEVGRQVFGIAIAIQTLLFGLLQPVTGMIADRYGARRVIAAGAVLYAAGLFLATTAKSPWELHLTLGVLVGLAMSGTTFVVVLGAVSRAVRPEHRSIAFGIVTAGGSFGQFAILPGAQAILSAFDWRVTFLALAAMSALMAVLARGVSGRPRFSDPDASPMSLREVVREARGHTGYWLLNAGFFVCGFHVAFIATHLPAFLVDRALSPVVGAWALALIGLLNIFGSYIFGALGARFRQKFLLSFMYFGRALAMTALIFVPLTPATALIFSSVIGFLWLGTVPLTSGIVARIFGTRYLSTLFGVVYLSHQVGGFLGAWLGGYAFDLLGSYDAVWLASIGLALLSVALHLPLEDRPPLRLRLASAAATQ